MMQSVQHAKARHETLQHILGKPTHKGGGKEGEANGEGRHVSMARPADSSGVDHLPCMPGAWSLGARRHSQMPFSLQMHSP